MGHAGAIISGGKGGALDKIRCLEQNGIHVVHNPAKMGEGMAMLMGVAKKTAWKRWNNEL